MLNSRCPSGLDGNGATVFGPVPAGEFFAIAAEFYATEPFTVTTESEPVLPVEQFVVDQGWVLDEEEPALAMTPLPPLGQLPTPPAELDIRRVVDEPAFMDFTAIAQSGTRWAPSLAAANGPRVALFVGYVDNKPGATARLIIVGDVGDITSVITLPAFQRRGYATAMTWATVAEGQRRGCNAMTLTATPMGYNVYLRMGFIPVCRYRPYLPPAVS